MSAMLSSTAALGLGLIGLELLWFIGSGKSDGITTLGWFGTMRASPSLHIVVSRRDKIRRLYAMLPYRSRSDRYKNHRTKNARCRSKMQDHGDAPMQGLGQWAGIVAYYINAAQRYIGVACMNGWEIGALSIAASRKTYLQAQPLLP